MSGKPSEGIPFRDIERILDPALRIGKVKNEPQAGNSGKGKTLHKKTQDQVDRLALLLEELGIPDIKPSKEDEQDLEHINQLAQAQIQLERLMDIEAEIVDTQRWNHDASKGLLNLALVGKRIPFETRSEIFDLRPTANYPSASMQAERVEDPKIRGMGKKVSAGEHSPAITLNEKRHHSSSKGKERADDPPPKRFVYHLLPEEAKESWLGVPGESQMYEICCRK